MSAIHHPPQNLPPLESRTSSRSPHLSMRPRIAERFSQLLQEIETFLRSCTYEEMCNFWRAIANLRQFWSNHYYHSEVPEFLALRRKHRDFYRILEVLADLTYPKMHLSSQLASQGDRYGFEQNQPYRAFGYPHLDSFNLASLN